MALQNTRALLFRGEDTSYGGAAAKEVVWTTTAVASARPVLMSLGFVGSTTQLNNLIGLTMNVAAAMGGLNRLIVNRSPTFWMTLTCRLGYANAGASIYTIAIPIAPRQMMFLPHTVYADGTTLLAADSAWPLSLPPGPAAGYTPPQAGSVNTVNFDWVAEQ